MEKTLVQNFLPSNQTQISVIIPANVSSYNFSMLRNFNLDDTKFNLVTRIESSIDTTGIYNIITSETVVVNGVNVVINPGYYTIIDMSLLFSCVIPISGENAFKTRLLQTTIFPINSQVAYILGFTNNLQSPSFTALSGSISPNSVNFTVDNDLIQIGSSLVDIANQGGLSNYLISIPINSIIGFINTYKIVCLKPIKNLMFNQIQFSIFNKYGYPLKIQSPIILIITLTTFDKSINK
jgi:hypothetical protein